MNNLKIIIPLKTNSKRVLNKNLRPFYNQLSLFDIKSRQLLNVFSPESIYVSSENPIVEKECKKYGFNFHLRDVKLTLNNTIESNLVKNIVDFISDKTCDIMWCQVTQPLFDEFDKLKKCYDTLDNQYDSICVVKEFRHHLINEYKLPINFNFGYWHKITQDLPSLYQITWSAFIMKRKMFDNNTYYQIGRNPYLFNTTKYLIDIDTENDFNLAKIIYKNIIIEKSINLYNTENFK